MITRLMSPSHPIITDRRVHIIRDNFHNFHFTADTGSCAELHRPDPGGMCHVTCNNVMTSELLRVGNTSLVTSVMMLVTRH